MALVAATAGSDGAAYVSDVRLPNAGDMEPESPLLMMLMSLLKYQEIASTTLNPLHPRRPHWHPRTHPTHACSLRLHQWCRLDFGSRREPATRARTHMMAVLLLSHVMPQKLVLPAHATHAFEPAHGCRKCGEPAA